MEKKVIDVIEKDVCRFFSIDEESLFMLKVEHGVQYLEKRFAHDPELMDRLKAHPQWWAWWAELWAERDRNLLSNLTHYGSWILFAFPVGREIKVSEHDSYQQKEYRRIPLCEAWEFYRKHHSPERVKFYPNYVLINQCLTSPQDKKGDTSTLVNA